MFSTLLLLLVVSSPSAVFGLPRLLLCPTGSVIVSYNLPLTNTFQIVTLTQFYNFTNCVDTYLQITGGSIQKVLSYNGSCTEGITIPPSIFNVTWVATGGPSYSTIQFPSGTEDDVNGEVVVTRTNGDVTSGALQGGSATLVVTVQEINITACAQNGIATQTGTAILEIIDL